MIELIIITLLFLLIVKGIPILRQIDNDYTKKYEQKNKWKENITRHYNGHHSQVNSFGYQDYRKHNYDDDNEYEL